MNARIVVIFCFLVLLIILYKYFDINTDKLETLECQKKKKIVFLKMHKVISRAFINHVFYFFLLNVSTARSLVTWSKNNLSTHYIINVSVCKQYSPEHIPQVW